MNDNIISHLYPHCFLLPPACFQTSLRITRNKRDSCKSRCDSDFKSASRTLKQCGIQSWYHLTGLCNLMLDKDTFLCSACCLYLAFGIMFCWAWYPPQIHPNSLFECQICAVDNIWGYLSDHLYSICRNCAFMFAYNLPKLSQLFVYEGVSITWGSYHEMQKDTVESCAKLALFWFIERFIDWISAKQVSWGCDVVHHI